MAECFLLLFSGVLSNQQALGPWFGLSGVGVQGLCGVAEGRAGWKVKWGEVSGFQKHV